VHLRPRWTICHKTTPPPLQSMYMPSSRSQHYGSWLVCCGRRSTIHHMTERTVTCDPQFWCSDHAPNSDGRNRGQCPRESWYTYDTWNHHCHVSIIAIEVTISCKAVAVPFMLRLPGSEQCSSIHCVKRAVLSVIVRLAIGRTFSYCMTQP
jgi:hypothetical protein